MLYMPKWYDVSTCQENCEKMKYLGNIGLDCVPHIAVRKANWPHVIKTKYWNQYWNTSSTTLPSCHAWSIN